MELRLDGNPAFSNQDNRDDKKRAGARRAVPLADFQLPEIVSKPCLIYRAILIHLDEFKQGKIPPILKGGKGGLVKRLIIPLDPPLVKGDLK
jgi:hypothetical protein